jgi:hypothetical protein
LGIVASGSGGGGSSNFINCGPDEVANQIFSAQAPIAIGINVVNHNELLLNGKHGNVSVSGLPGATSITVTGMKRVLSESVQDAQAHLQDVRVTAQDLTTRALLETNQPQCELGRKYIVDYAITLPNFFLVRINNNGGDVTVDSIDNDVSVNSIAGTVTLTDIVSSAAVDLISGDIVAEITFLPLNGTIEMSILTGDINLEIPTNTSADFSARVFSGNINLTNLMLLNQVVTATSVTGILGTGQGNILLETEVIGDINVLGI